MPATVAQLGARVLRKLGVALVANADRPEDGPTLTAGDVAGRVLRELGIPVAEPDRPDILPFVPLADVAARALRAVGINPVGLITGLFSGTAYTFQQISNAVLIKLGVVAADEVASNNDLTVAYSRVVDTHDQMVQMGLADWPVTAIPAYAAEPYIIMAANYLAPAFGKPVSLEAISAAQDMLRRNALSGPRGQALAEAHVRAVHDGLNAQGLVAWPVTAVPAAHADDYANMASMLLAPSVGKPADKALWDAGEAAIRKASVIRGAELRASESVQRVQTELNANGLVGWDSDHIPAALGDAMATMAAMQMGPEFGRPMDPKAYDAAEARVWRVSMGGAVGQALAEQKVRGIQTMLEARGLARWSAYDIPAFAEEPMVFMAATWLAPECRMKADPAWWASAEADLMRIIMLPTDYSPVQAAYF